MARQNQQEEQWRQADEEVRKNLPPGVKLVRTLRGHKAPIGHIAWSPDGETLASASYDGYLRLWDQETGNCTRTEESTRVCPLLIWLSRSLILSGRSLMIWDATTGEEHRYLSDSLLTIRCLSRSPDGGTVAAAEYSCVLLWDVGTGRKIGQLRPRSWDDPVNSLAWRPDGAHLIVASKAIEIWDPFAKELIREISISGGQGHDGARGFAWLPASRIFASAHGDATIRFWDGDTGVELRRLEGHTSKVSSIAFSNDGSLLAWMPMQKKKPNRIAGLLAFFPR
jgi:WD40 repeat protein